VEGGIGRPAAWVGDMVLGSLHTDYPLRKWEDGCADWDVCGGLAFWRIWVYDM
jgi:hypothetical protein